MKLLVKPRRTSLRLQDFDYTKIGGYFVTICTKNRKNLFGEIKEGAMILNALGEIVQEEWLYLPKLRSNVELDQFVVMPNHFHAILFLINEIKGTASRAPTKREFGQSVSGSLSTILGVFKSGVAKRINRLLNHNLAGLWQRSFFEHIIRDEASLVRVGEYILTNPFRWELDRENLQRTGEDEFDLWMDGFYR